MPRKGTTTVNKLVRAVGKSTDGKTTVSIVPWNPADIASSVAAVTLLAAACGVFTVFMAKDCSAND